ncbi:MAG: hypothetical protein D6744_12665 [Planctomycetota bacterium]|nr:MAG: hypothetical protein D6744_12665 [Planctomycetota bacterium]
MTNFFGISFRIGQIAGINIRVHILFIIWIVFELATSGVGWRFEAQMYGLLFGIVLLHELGHCFGARAVGGDARDIVMWPLGGLAFAHAPMTPWAQFVTVAAGPAVNLVFCLISGGLLVGYLGTLDAVSFVPFRMVPYPPGIPEWCWYAQLFFTVNYLLLAFNLLPVYPLDGGQLLQCVLWPFVGLQRALVLSCQIGIIGCIGFGLWALQGGGNMLFFIAIFGGMTCYQRLQMVKYGMVIDERMRYAPTRTANRPGFWRRVFGGRRGAHSPGVARNPNPDGWRERIEERRRQEEEVERILAKIKREGIQSLSYVERQILERASRERRRRDG